MSFFGKIKSAVMGNPVTRDYDIGKQVASAGPGLMWKVHQAIKKSTRQEMSVFLFNKQTPDFEKLHKKQRDLILEVLRKGPTHLVRLKHPRLLTIDHPLEESSNCLAFATEAVSIGVANILGNYDNLPSPLPLTIKEYEVHPIEIQYGLFNLSEALEFLHSGVRLMHGNITPEVVVVTEGGTWKLMGFNFSCYSQYQSETTTTFEFQEWDSRRPHITNPSLDYLAPEYILSRSCSEKSDIYSFGMLCYAVYNGGRPLCSSLNNLLSFKQNVETISRVTESGLGEVPHGLRALVRSMLAVEPSVRPDAMEISKHAFFDEVGVATLRYLDTLYEKGDMERSQYFKKNLALVITKLPKRVIHQRVLPALKEEFRNNKMVPFILPIVLLIAEDCTMQEYSDVIMPVLIPSLRIQDPIQVPLILLQKMDLVLKKTPSDDIKQHVLPMIIASLETTNTQLQELCISLLPSFATTIDYSSMKHSIIPRLSALMISAGSVSLRVKCLVAMAKMLDSLDKHIVHDHILPLLQQIPSREPPVLMAVLGIYHSVLTNKKLGMDKVFLATRVLPFLLPLTVEPTLNIGQFNQMMMVVRTMLQNVETEQQTHLEQLSKMEEQTKSTVDFAREVSDTKAMEDAINTFEETFGAGSYDSHMIPKRGSTVPTTSSDGLSTAKQSATNAGDMFAGLLPSQPSSHLTPPQQHTPHITSSHTLNPTTGTTSPSPHTTPTSTSSAMATQPITPLQPSQQPLSGTGTRVSNMGTRSQPGSIGTRVSDMGMRPQSGSIETGVSNMGMKTQSGSIGTSVSNMGTRPQTATPNLLGGSQRLQTESPKLVSFQTAPVSQGSKVTTGMEMGGGSSGVWNRNTGMGTQPQSSTNVSSIAGWTSTIPRPSNTPQQPLMSGHNSIFGGMTLHDTQGTNQMSAGGHMTGTTNQMTGGQGHMTGTTNQMMSGGQSHMTGSANQMMSGGQSHMTGSANQMMSGGQSHMTGSAMAGGQSHMTGTTNQMMTGGQGHMSGTTNQMSGGQSHMTGSAMAGGQSHMTGHGSANQIGAVGSTPIIPTRVGMKSPLGWLSGIDTAQDTVGVNQPMGWSSNIGGATQSMNPGPNLQPSMSIAQMMTPIQPSAAPSSNWSIPPSSTSMPSMNWTSQNTNPAPTAASLMTGGPLLAQGSSPAPIQPSQNKSDNPFADLSFLG